MKILPFDIAEMLALLTSILCFKRIRNTPLLLFIPYLTLVVTTEMLGKYWGSTNNISLNIKLYNVTTVLEFLFFYYLFYQCITKQIFKQLIIYFSVFYVTATVINQVFIQGFEVFHSYTMLLGTIIIIVFVFFYFYDAFERKEPLYLLKEPMFWISTGIFLFYLGDFTFNLMLPYLSRHHLANEKRLFRMINNNLIIVMYLSFITGLILCNRTHSALKPQ